MVNENLYIQAGHLTRNPETSDLNNGGKVVNFGLASNRRWNNRQTGEQQEETTFTEWEAYGPQVETIMQYLQKGSPVYCRGRARFQQWQDATSGENRSRITFVLDRFEFQGTRESNGLSAGQAPAAQAPAQQNQAAAPAANVAPPVTAPVDDIPF